MNIDNVIMIYNQTGSLKETALNTGIHWQKVRKILISKGLYETDLSKMINDLYMSGKSVSDIVKQFNISIKTVNSYLPYQKCIYNDNNASANAIRIRKYRSKQ